MKGKRERSEGTWEPNKALSCCSGKLQKTIHLRREPPARALELLPSWWEVLSHSQDLQSHGKITASAGITAGSQHGSSQPGQLQVAPQFQTASRRQGETREQRGNPCRGLRGMRGSAEGSEPTPKLSRSKGGLASAEPGWIVLDPRES